MLSTRMFAALALVAVMASPQLSARQQAASGEESQQPRAKSSQDAKPVQQPSKNLKLNDVTKVSTAKAARAAAQDLSKGRETSGKPMEGGAVTEFHAAGVSGQPATVVKSRQKKAANVHGSVYGARGGLGSQAAGSVGATSKSGKTSVYVETDRSHSSAASPQ